MYNVLQILIPIFLVILIGFFFGGTTVKDDHAKALNSFVYYFAFPAVIINSLQDKNFSQILNLHFIFGYSIAAIIVFVCGIVLSSKSAGSLHKTMMALASSFPNCGYIGIPLVIALLGKAILLPSIVATILSLVHLALGICLLEVFSSNDKMAKQILVAIKTSFFNPMIFCFIIGLLIIALHITLPTYALKTLNLIAAACVPCALFGIGHNLAITRKKALFNGFNLIKVVFLKNILQPLITLALLSALHTNFEWIVIGVLMSSLSTGLVIPLLADKYQAYQDDAPQAVFATTFVSIISLSLWILLLQYLYPDMLWQ